MDERHVALPLVTGSGDGRVDVAAAWGDRPRMRDLQPFIETLRMCIPIAEVVAESVELTPDGDALRGRCSAHRDDARGLYVLEGLGSYHCFSCGRRGDVVRWARETACCSEEDAIALLCHRAGLPVPRPRLP